MSPRDPFDRRISEERYTIKGLYSVKDLEVKLSSKLKDRFAQGIDHVEFSDITLNGFDLINSYALLPALRLATLSFTAGIVYHEDGTEQWFPLKNEEVQVTIIDERPDNTTPLNVVGIIQLSPGHFVFNFITPFNHTVLKITLKGKSGSMEKTLVLDNVFVDPPPTGFEIFKKQNCEGKSKYYSLDKTYPYDVKHYMNQDIRQFQRDGKRAPANSIRIYPHPSLALSRKVQVTSYYFSSYSRGFASGDIDNILGITRTFDVYDQIPITINLRYLTRAPMLRVVYFGDTIIKSIKLKPLTDNIITKEEVANMFTVRRSSGHGYIIETFSVHVHFHCQPVLTNPHIIDIIWLIFTEEQDTIMIKYRIEFVNRREFLINEPIIDIESNNQNKKNLILQKLNENNIKTKITDKFTTELGELGDNQYVYVLFDDGHRDEFFSDFVIVNEACYLVIAEERPLVLPLEIISPFIIL